MPDTSHMGVVTKTWNDPQRPTTIHNDPQRPTTTPQRPHNDPQRPTTTHNDPTTTHNDPQDPTMTHKTQQRATTTQNQPQRPTTSHNDPQVHNNPTTTFTFCAPIIGHHQYFHSYSRYRENQGVGSVGKSIGKISAYASGSLAFSRQF